MVIDIGLRIYKNTHNFEHSYRKFADANYNKLHNKLSNYDWSKVYNNKSVDDAVDSLNATVHYIPLGSIRKTKYPSWFSATLRYFIRKKNYYHKRFKKKNTDYFYNQSSKYRNLVKTTIKPDRLAWLKSTDENLKRQPTEFWEYVSTLRKSNSALMQLHVDATCTDGDGGIAEAFTQHFYTSYSRISPPLSSVSAHCSDFLPLAPISDLDI
jgi:ribosomal protein L24E